MLRSSSSRSTKWLTAFQGRKFGRNVSALREPEDVLLSIRLMIDFVNSALTKVSMSLRSPIGYSAILIGRYITPSYCCDWTTMHVQSAIQNRGALRVCCQVPPGPVPLPLWHARYHTPPERSHLGAKSPIVHDHNHLHWQRRPITVSSPYHRTPLRTPRKPLHYCCARRAYIMPLKIKIPKNTQV